MKTWHDIIIYGNPNGGLPTEKELHDWAKTNNNDSVRILYYGLAVKGNCWGGDSAAQRMIAIVELSANTPEDIVRIYSNLGWPKCVASIKDKIEKGIFGTSKTVINSFKSWKKNMIPHLGEKYGVACLYDFNETSKTTKIFTFGDKRKTVNHFNAELIGNVKATFAKDLSGTGIPQEFSIDANTVKVKLTKDNKARLCFAVHMKSSKKDFADVKLQTKINELRKEISFKYGVDIDIVDIRSTIEYI